MLVRRTNPFPDLARFQRRFDAMSGRFFENLDAPVDGSAWAPAIDVIEQEDQILLRAELPGMTEEDVDITLEEGKLALKGEKTFQHDASDGHYRRIESGYGSFSRTFNLPTAVDQERIDAQFRSGVLLITLPKAEQAKPKKIAVTVN